MTARRRRARRLPAAMLVAAAAVVLTTACVPEPEVTDAATAAPAETATPVPTAQPTQVLPPGIRPPAPLPTGPVDSATTLPDNCRALLTEPVARQLDEVALDTAILADGTLRCVWGEPGAATVRLVTTISYAPHNDTIDYLNALMDDGFVCFSPDDGVRCELSWDNPLYGVEDGRTLYFRDEVLIDSQYSHLAPSGYTAAIVRAIWPPDATPAPTPSPSPGG